MAPRSLRSTGTATDALISEHLLRKRARERQQQPSRAVAPKHEEPAPPAEETCPICLCGLSDPDLGASGTTVCGHKFHLSCLSTWMAMDHRRTCPECRTFVGGSASKSRMFVADAQRQPRRNDDKRMPRFHGG